MTELSELSDLLDATPPRGEKPTSKEQIQAAIQALLQHQVIYSDTHGAMAAYQTIQRHRSFFEKYFDAAGRKLIIVPTEGMMALMPDGEGGARPNRFTKDETFVLLALRYLLEDGYQKGMVTENGRVDTETDEVLDVIRTISGSVVESKEGAFRNILVSFQRLGLLRLGERDRDAKNSTVAVLPGVRLIVSDAFTRHIVAWAETPEAQRETTDIFEFAQERRAASAAEAEAAATALAAADPLRIDDDMALSDMDGADGRGDEPAEGDG